MPLTTAAGAAVTLATDLGITGQQTVPFTWTNPLAGNTQLANIVIALTTSAVVATRRIDVNVFDENGLVRLRMLGAGTQIAGQTQLHSLVQGDDFLIAFALAFPIQVPAQFYMRKDWRIDFRVINGQAADTQRIMFQLVR